MTLDSLFLRAMDHRSEHGCSAYPYQSFQQLFEIVTKCRPVRILEVGTGVGFTACVMLSAAPRARLTTLEKDPVHVQAAQDFVRNYLVTSPIPASVDISQVQVINAVAEQFLPQLHDQYDLIFFDGYQIHYEFLPHYERLLQSGGWLVLGNTQLSSRTSDRFFEQLQDPLRWQIVDRFGDTILARRV